MLWQVLTSLVNETYTDEQYAKDIVSRIERNTKFKCTLQKVGTRWVIGLQM